MSEFSDTQTHWSSSPWTKSKVGIYHSDNLLLVQSLPQYIQQWEHLRTLMSMHWHLLVTTLVSLFFQQLVGVVYYLLPFRSLSSTGTLYDRNFAPKSKQVEADFQ
ncbi:hypothetical protein BT96DRAFT_338895 [Gymnopus androsaceus JB14]|uniref:Uncharacterized protein n=1 Tax=Gymnopus androsaceus JB14 TaxID=1447944 RepID=A0A6A4I3T2_9AGAR|nr:hypothetical protein BT96DRAFT_338895 [Gymnopus androsaceus JB14]